MGLDLHDCPAVERNIPLQPGMVITVEPGVYVPRGDTRFPSKYHGIGIRIEDDVVIQPDDVLVLSRNVPKELCEISA